MAPRQKHSGNHGYSGGSTSSSPSQASHPHPTVGLTGATNQDVWVVNHIATRMQVA